MSDLGRIARPFYISLIITSRRVEFLSPDKTCFSKTMVNQGPTLNKKTSLFAVGGGGGVVCYSVRVSDYYKGVTLQNS